MGYGLDSPGNQPIGPPYGQPKYYPPTCVNHDNIDAVALWNCRLREPVCMKCL